MKASTKIEERVNFSCVGRAAKAPSKYGNVK